MLFEKKSNLIFCFTIFLLIGSIAVKKDAGKLNFIVIADWGGQVNSPFHTVIETAVARRMAHIAKIQQSKFVLAIGDNFYTHGVKDVDDSRFQTTFERVYHQPELQIDWFLVAGNHDHLGNVSAQIDYSEKSKRWNFPSYYYLIKKQIPNTDISIDIVMIDTVILCGATKDESSEKLPEKAPSSKAAKKQFKWIKNALKTSNSTYLIIAGHYPIYSIAEHGPTQCLIDNLFPMMQKYRVSAYMGGHDHNLQYLEYKNQSMFISGAAAVIDPSKQHANSVPKGSSKFYWADYNLLGGFSHVSVTKKSLVYTFEAANGKTLYKKEIFPRGS